ncbi:MAG TPA: hypothetical protein VFY28_03585 [Candidatus Paceibacterota bacterium]|nr:hypothetical protein [Candidatus Paceibacterota bacterium]
MWGNNRNVPGGGKPTEERRREYGPARAVGKTEKAMADVEQLEQEERNEELREGLPEKEDEVWKHRIRKDGTRLPGTVEVSVCRNPKGQFANLARERAAYFGIMTGRDVPPPARRKV